MQANTIGLDIAKNVMQVHGVDASGAVGLRQRLSRAKTLDFFKRLRPCLVGMEACGSAHHWARQIAALGHEVRMIPPVYVKPYVKRSKTDAADAAAICEAVSRPHMRFVPVKSEAAQALALIYKTRGLLVAQRAALANSLRAHLGEFGIIAAQGPAGMTALTAVVRAGDARLPELAREGLSALADAMQATEAQTGKLDARIAAMIKGDAACRRLQAVPGVGPVAAGTLTALAGDLSRFRSGRDFAAWLGLTPRQNSSGDKVRLGKITKAGDKGLRTLPVMGALAVIRHTRGNPAKGIKPLASAGRAAEWLSGLLARRPPLVAAVALAAKTARIVWAMITRGETYKLAAA
jgi:transposase